MINASTKDYLEKIKNRSLQVGVIGLGYVGLPLVIRLLNSGFKVVGFDIDSVKIEKLNAGVSYFNHISSESILEAKKNDNLILTSDFQMASRPDALIICVPTPLGVHQEPDMSYIENTLSSILPHLRAHQLLSLESTTYPGTTEELIQPLLTQRGFKLGEDFYLVFSPEREDPGNLEFSLSEIPKVIGGVTPHCLEVGASLYGSIVKKVVPVSSPRAAEMSKLLENIYRSVNIGLVNEMKIVADKMGINIWEVIEAASTKPFGFTPFYPGPGLGGHCIPIDPYYLTWKAKEYGIHTRFIELAGEVNTSMPEWVVQKVTSALNEKRIAVKGSKILLLGLSYKKNIDDVRESPSVELLQLLSNLGADVSYSDPYVPHFPKMRNYKFDLSSTSVTSDNLKNYDCVLIATDHDSFDYPLILEKSSLIIDTRGRFRTPHPNVVSS